MLRRNFFHTNASSLFRTIGAALLLAFAAASVPASLFYVMASTWPNGPTDQTVLGLGFGFFQGAVIATGLLGGTISVALVLFSTAAATHHLVRAIQAARGYHLIVTYALLVAWISMAVSSVAHLEAAPAVSTFILLVMIAAAAFALKVRRAPPA